MLLGNGKVRWVYIHACVSDGYEKTLTKKSGQGCHGQLSPDIGRFCASNTLQSPGHMRRPAVRYAYFFEFFAGMHRVY
jgi:hypothetical protein